MLSLSAFASHDWGRDALNHKRVAKVVSLLRERAGLNVWFDETHMRGNVLDSMCRGIDESDCVLVFVTAAYVDKVQRGSNNDNVRREFMYASSVKADSMIAIRFDAHLGSRWQGPVGMVLGSQFYIDLSRDELITDAAITSLVQLIKTHSRHKTAAMRRLKSAARVSRWSTAKPPIRRPPADTKDGALQIGGLVLKGHEKDLAVAQPLPRGGAGPDVRGRVQKVASLLNLNTSNLHIVQILARAADTLGVAEQDDVFYERLKKVECHLGLTAFSCE